MASRQAFVVAMPDDPGAANARPSRLDDAEGTRMTSIRGPLGVLRTATFTPLAPLRIFRN
jgi:hypothetical protein